MHLKFPRTRELQDLSICGDKEFVYIYIHPSVHVTSLYEYNCLCVNETICICNNIQAIILANVESSVQTDKPIQVVNWQMLCFRNLSIYNKAAI